MNPALEAARVTDPIEHSRSFGGFVLGAAVGLAVGAAMVAATVATGGLALVAAVGGAAAATGGTALLGQALGGTLKVPAGSLAPAGSSTVFIGGLPAARAA